MSISCPECGADYSQIVKVVPARDIVSLNEDGSDDKFLGTEPGGTVGDRGTYYRCECGVILDQEDGKMIPVDSDPEPVECPDCGNNEIVQKRAVMEVRPVISWTYDNGKIANTKTGDVSVLEEQYPGLVTEVIFECRHCDWTAT